MHRRRHRYAHQPVRSSPIRHCRASAPSEAKATSHFLAPSRRPVHGCRYTQTIDCHSIQAAIKFIQAQSRLRKWINEETTDTRSSRAVILGPHPHSELPEPGQRRHVLLAISSSTRNPGCSLSCHQTTVRVRSTTFAWMQSACYFIKALPSSRFAKTSLSLPNFYH